MRLRLTRFGALGVGVGAGVAATLVLVDRLLRLDSGALATGVTLAATIVTTAATAALGWFGWVQIEDARRRQRGVAAGLLHQVRAIRDELGPRPTPGEMQGNALVGDAQVPAIHEWFLPVIPQIAESDASIIGLFLVLDRGLYNLRKAVKSLREAREELTAKREALEGYQRTYAHEAAEMDDVTAWGEARQALNVATQNAERAARFATTVYTSCHKTLDELEAALSAVMGTGYKESSAPGAPAQTIAPQDAAARARGDLHRGG